MSSLKQFKMPDVGEGLTEAEILRWMVQPGDTVAVNQDIVEIETAKAAVELPCPFAGVVSELHFEEGTTVDVGTPIITIETEPASGSGSVAAPSSQAPAQPAALGEDMVPQVPAATAATAATSDDSSVRSPGEDEAVEPGLIGGPGPGGRTSVLVGYGPKTTTAKRRERKQAPAMPGSEQPAGLAEATSDTAVAARVQPSTGPERQVTERSPADVAVLAKPPVRKLARDLGVDLRAVAPSGPAGTITREDVEAAASGANGRIAEAAPSTALAGWDANREQRFPVKGVRKMMAQAMVSSAFTAPHVTEWVSVDVTRTVELTDRLKAMPEFRDVKVSPLLLVAKAILLAVKRNPGVNASWDEENQEVVHKEYVNLGIAAATPRGLIVPNVKGADAMDLATLGRALNELVATARDGKTAPADMAHGTITITNVGVFGVDAGTPIINPGESAILCFGAVRDMPWVVDGAVVPRKVTQLTLSFDHRHIDGELGSRFLADVARILADPAEAILFA